MACKAGSFTPVGTGITPVNNLPFLPTRIFIRVGSQAGGSPDATTTSRCDGWATASNQSYDTWYNDGTLKKQNNGTNKLIVYYYKVGATVNEVINATFVDFHENTPTNFGFTFNYTLNDVPRQVKFMVDDV